MACLNNTCLTRLGGFADCRIIFLVYGGRCRCSRHLHHHCLRVLPPCRPVCVSWIFLVPWCVTKIKQNWFWNVVDSRNVMNAFEAADIEDVNLVNLGNFTIPYHKISYYYVCTVRWNYNITATLCPRKTKRSFSTILFRTDEIFTKFGGLIHSWVYSVHNCSCISNKACVIPLPETFYFNDILQNWNRLHAGIVEWRKLDHSILLQPSIGGVAVSLLVSGLTVDILSTFCGVFMVHCVSWCW